MIDKSIDFVLDRGILPEFVLFALDREFHPECALLPGVFFLKILTKEPLVPTFKRLLFVRIGSY